MERTGNWGKKGVMTSPRELRVGLPRSYQEFCEQAIKAKHPLSEAPHIGDDVKMSIFSILTLGPSNWLNQFKGAWGEWPDVKPSLREKERKLHDHL